MGWRVEGGAEGKRLRGGWKGITLSCDVLTDLTCPLYVGVPGEW